jgi:hypothetical protein
LTLYSNPNEGASSPEPAQQALPLADISSGVEQSPAEPGEPSETAELAGSHDEAPAPGSFEAAELQRYQVETEGIKARNEGERDEASALIRDRDERRDAEIEAEESDTETTKRERHFFMGLTAFGALFAASAWTVAAISGHWVFYPSSVVGLLAFAGGLSKLWIQSSRDSTP